MEAEASIIRPSSYSRANREILRVLFKPSPIYLVVVATLASGCAFGLWSWWQQFTWGMGVDGMNQSSFWGVYIVSFVFWIGIGHAGTLISAILYLVRSRWRTGVYRASEAMTVFAVLTAALFPLVHLGRIWQFYWFFPYPNQRSLWVNFKSPLMWDVFAISTYFTISVVFFYCGLLPDMAIVRDHSRGLVKRVYNTLCLGWRGTNRQWRHYMAAYGFFAAFATPLVLSVHSVVSWDFAMANLAGWHSTIFPPYFVAGAIYSGCAMVITLLLPMTYIFGWKEYVNMWHFESLAKMCLLTSGILTYSYFMENFIAWYSQNPAEQAIFWWRATGPLAWAFYLAVFCNVITPLSLYIPAVRRNPVPLFIVSIIINVGMFMERFNIVVSSTAHSLDPNMWRLYAPTAVEMGVLLGSLSWFLLQFFLFIKVMPGVAINEVKEMTPPPLKGSLEAS